MLPKAEMVPKECGFNQSETACGLCARIAWRFPYSPAMPRDGELIEMQHSCLHVDIIRHPNSSYVTTKLYGTSTCGCNNNTIFSEGPISTFPTVDVCQAHWPGSGEALVIHCQGGKMAALLNSLFFVLNISFLPKYRVKYDGYIVKWCSGI